MAYCVNGCWTVLSNVGIGTDDLATYHQAYMSPSLNIVGSRPSLNFENNAGSLSTIRLKGTAAAAEMHINFDGTSCTNGRLYFYTYACANRSLLTLALNGNVGIGVDVPFSPHNGNGLVVKGNGGRGIMELWDGSALAGKSVFQNVEGDTYFGQLDRGTGCGRLYFLTGGSGTSATISMTILCAGNVGIGTTSPGYKLTISDTAATKLSLCGGTAQNGITFEKAGSGCSYYIFNGDYANLCGFGIYNVNTAALPMFINNSSNVGINTASPSYRLHVNGTFYAAGSSIKYKEGICNYDTDSCLFMCLKPVTYQYKDEWQHLGRELKSQSQIGLIAEDVAEVMPELAVLVNEDDEKVVRNVDYEKLSVVLLKEVQKLRLEVDQLKNNK